MSRLIAYIGSDPERLRAALLEYRALLLTAPVEATEGVVGWGIGFYQGGRFFFSAARASQPASLTCSRWSRTCAPIFF